MGRWDACCDGPLPVNPMAARWWPWSKAWSPASRSPPMTSPTQLARRRLGYGRGARMKFEADQVTMLAGVRHGLTLGGPIAIEVGNTEWPKWETVMAADPVDAAALDVARNAPLTRPRPGHADYAGMLKYGFDDARPVLERASARETAARVAAGTVARAFLRAGARRRGALPRHLDRGVDALRRTAAAAGRPGRHRRQPGAGVRQAGGEGHDRRDRGRQEGRRHPRRRRRGGRRTACRSGWVRSPAATTGSTANSPAR